MATEDMFGDAGTSFEADAGPKSVEHISFDLRKEFFPWHKPRKQMMRAEQWCASVDRLVDNLRLTESAQPLSYLSLPGPDLLDVRSLQPVCVAKNVTLSFVGLNSGDDDDPTAPQLNALMLSEVRAMPNIHQDSDVVEDQFEHLAKKKSIAHDRIIVGRRSFDVINIDLCGSLAEGKAGVKGANLINALYALIRHQAESRTGDWILFLTTRSNQEAVDPSTMSGLVNGLNELLKTQPELLDGWVTNKLLRPSDVVEGKIDLAKLNVESYSNSFALGVAHWVLQGLFGHQPAWRVDMLPQYSYRVYPKGTACDMLSLGFYCKRLPSCTLPDSFGLAVLDQKGSEPEDFATQHKTCLEKINRRVGDAKDVDVLLYKDDALYQKYLEQSAELMRGAHYDVEAFREFAEIDRLKIAAFLEKFNIV